MLYSEKTTVSSKGVRRNGLFPDLQATKDATIGRIVYHWLGVDNRDHILSLISEFRCILDRRTDEALVINDAIALLENISDALNNEGRVDDTVAV